MLSQLRLLDFRCYGQFRWELPSEGAIIHGANAEGKTSLLEAVCFLLRLQSPRSSRAGHLVRHGSEAFGIRGSLMEQTRRVYWTSAKTDLQVNGEHRRDQRSYLIDSLPVVWLGNGDLDLVRGRSESRRKYLDFLGSQWHPAYRVEAHRYQRALLARNHLLKHKPGDRRQMAAYTEALAVHGEALITLRAQLADILKPHIVQAYQAISGGGEVMGIVYRPSVAHNLAGVLSANLPSDTRYGQTRSGPHRDDLDITVNGMAAAQFASEGQQRSLAIAMKLAQSSLLREETGHSPIHLIDDVFGELDPARRLALLRALPPDSQNLITTTHLDWLRESPGLPTFELNGHVLKPS